MKELPDCGIYRTSEAIGDVPAEQLVYFHNHGDPGPGIYLPEKWHNNQVQFSSQGRTLKDPVLAHTLEPIMEQALYRVGREFYCCWKNCVHFKVNQLVQLGYDGKANPILFFPFWKNTELCFPQKGTRIEAENFQFLELLKIPLASKGDPGMMH